MFMVPAFLWGFIFCPIVLCILPVLNHWNILPVLKHLNHFACIESCQSSHMTWGRSQKAGWILSYVIYISIKILLHNIPFHGLERNIFIFLHKLDLVLFLHRHTHTDFPDLPEKVNPPFGSLSILWKTPLLCHQTNCLTRGKEPDLQYCLYFYPLAETIW